MQDEQHERLRGDCREASRCVTLYFFAGLVVGLIVGGGVTRLRDRKAIRQATADLKRHTNALIEAQTEIHKQP